MGTDVEYQREAAQIMAEAACADAEAAHLFEAEHGPYPNDEDERAELDGLARSAR